MRNLIPVDGSARPMHGPGMDEPGPLYETDFPAWAEGQAAALRARPELARLGLDLPNLIEELETLAREEVRALEDGVRTGLVRLLLAAAEPDPARAAGPLSQVSGPLIAARRHLSPTGRARLDPDRLWAEAWEEAVAALPDGALPAEPFPCPIPVWPLLERGFRPREALERVREALAATRTPTPGGPAAA